MIKYVLHDTNASRDPKLADLRMKHGVGGYGVFWLLIEEMASSANGNLKADYNYLGWLLRAPAEIIKSVVTEFDLFSFSDDGKYFFSHRLNRNIAASEQKSEAARAKVNKRWEKSKNSESSPDNKNDTIEIPQYNHSKTTEIQIKEKKIKGNNSSKQKTAKQSTTTNEKKAGVFDASSFLPAPGQTEDPAGSAIGGKIVATTVQLEEFRTAIGATQLSEIEKMHISHAIEQGCTTEHLKKLLLEKPEINSFKADWVIRSLIAVKRKSEAANKGKDATIAELEEQYGSIT